MSSYWAVEWKWFTRDSGCIFHWPNAWWAKYSQVGWVFDLGNVIACHTLVQLNCPINCLDRKRSNNATYVETTVLRCDTCYVDVALRAKVKFSALGRPGDEDGYLQRQLNHEWRSHQFEIANVQEWPCRRAARWPGAVGCPTRCIEGTRTHPAQVRGFGRKICPERLVHWSYLMSVSANLQVTWMSLTKKRGQLQI